MGMSPLNMPLVVDIHKCTGCRLCEMICSLEHEGVNNPALSRITILKQEQLGVHIPAISVNCDLCEGEMKCVKYCPTKALRFVKMKDAAKLRREMQLNTLIAPNIPIRINRVGR